MVDSQPAPPIANTAGSSADERVARGQYRLIGARRAIARNMIASLAQSAQVTSWFSLRADALTALRAELEPCDGPTYLALVLTAISRVLPNHPVLNATLVDDTIQLWESVNLGIGVATPRQRHEFADGLAVPVLKGADQKSLSTVAKEAGDLIEGAKARTLPLDQFQGSTFTVSNVGGLPGSRQWLGSTPILNADNTAILWVGAIRDEPRANSGSIEVGPLLPLCLTHDHRVVDGSAAAAFMAELLGLLESRNELNRRLGL